MKNKMAINAYLSTIEYEKQNKQAEQKQTHKNIFTFSDGREIGRNG